MGSVRYAIATTSGNTMEMHCCASICLDVNANMIANAASGSLRGPIGANVNTHAIE